MRQAPTSVIAALHSGQVVAQDDGQYWYAWHDMGGMQQTCSRPYRTATEAYEALKLVAARGYVKRED